MYVDSKLMVHLHKVYSSHSKPKIKNTQLSQYQEDTTHISFSLRVSRIFSIASGVHSQLCALFETALMEHSRIF